VLVTHPGTQHSFRLAAELEHRDALMAFYTGAAFTAGGLVDSVWQGLPGRWRRILERRRIAGLSPRHLHCRVAGEIAALWRLRGGADAQQVMHRRNKCFQESIPDRALTTASAVIGFDTAAWILCGRCQEHSVPIILDQSIGHPDTKIATYKLVREQYPEWSDGIEARRCEVREAERQEHEKTSCIVAGSSFVKQTLVDQGVAPEKIRVNPYGVDCQRFRVSRHRHSGPLRFLFVGGINARKGVQLLIDAWRKLSTAGAELWLVGGASKNVLELLPDLPGLRYLGRVPNEEVAELMQQCDVFVFPSYFEGLALVILEAMACGLPVITTSASGGCDVITDGKDGWIIGPGDLTGLVDRMSYCLEHRQIVRDMGLAARATAERFTWSAYGDRWMQILAEVCG